MNSNLLSKLDKEKKDPTIFYSITWNLSRRQKQNRNPVVEFKGRNSMGNENWIGENKEKTDEMIQIRIDGKNIIDLKNLHSHSLV